MKQPVPRYYAGMLALGSKPDWDRAAKTIDLLRSVGVELHATPAVVRADGTTVLPFFARSLADGMGRVDPRYIVESLSPYRLASYTELDPRTASPFVLGVLARLGEEEGGRRSQPTRVRDIQPRPAPLASPNDAFAGLVGLEQQRTAVGKIATLVKKHGRSSVECLHMVFTGAPGTGKTELARRLLAHFDTLGVTDGQGTFVQASAADLLGLYVGHTPTKTRAVVERALGGLLFIDEAYTLLSANDFGQEAIDTLSEMLESERHRLVCVIAGYPHEIEQLFQRNPGLRDRFGFRITFENYTTAELTRIFEHFAHERNFVVDPCACGVLESCLRTMRGQRDFANARSVRRLFDRALIECACRSDDKVLTAADIRGAFAQPDLGATPRASIVGFGRP